MRRVDRTSGLYTPTDKVWQINRELLVMLAGSRALLLELAHPLIAAGVAHHSDFRQRPLKRLISTIRSMFYLTFGNDEVAQIVLRHIHHCHRLVNGQLRQPAGSLAAGTPYAASDPALRLWVFATLVDSILVVHDQLVHPLSLDEKAVYYDESRRMARALSIPNRILPTTYQQFCDYVNIMQTDGTLVVSEDARAVLDSLFYHPLLGWLLRTVSFPGIGLLPPDLRAAFGLAWSPRHDRWFARLARVARTLRRALPPWVCVYPGTW